MSERAAQLERRVRWLDRRRRAIAVGTGVVVMLLVAYAMTQLMDDNWPAIHASALSMALGLLAWLAVEIALAWVAALWESEHDELLHHGLPRAVARRRK